jgi:hypothetical protein
VLTAGAMFSDYARAVHIIAVVLAFGIPLTQPVIEALVERVDRTAVPVFHQVRKLAGRWLVNPSLLIVLIAGIVLASDKHVWKAFFVQWGVGAIIVFGALEGSFMMPRFRRLAELAKRDLDAGSTQWSEDYVALSRSVRRVGALIDLLVIVTVLIMATRP